MSDFIVTCIHHGGTFIKEPIPAYVGEKGIGRFPIDKDHFSIFELLYYTKELGYATVEGLYCKNSEINDFVLLDSDIKIIELVKDLENGDLLELYVLHVMDEAIFLDNMVPTCYNNISVEVSSRATNEANGDINTQPQNEEVRLGLNLHDVRFEKDERLQGGQADMGEELQVDFSEFSDLEGLEDELDSSSDSELDDVPDDDSDVDDELKIIRQERRTKKLRRDKLRHEFKNKNQKKKPTKPPADEGIPLGEASVDRGFEDFGKDKANKYAGKLGGDENYIGNSDLDSDDSEDELDVDAVRGVDLPQRRKSKKVRYDGDCAVSFFELGMIFENAIQFRKVVADYAIEYKVHLKMRPNEKKRVRVKCLGRKCKWELFASLHRDSGDFVVKKYHPYHKCPTYNKNKFCSSNFIAEKYESEIVSHPYMRIWEIQEKIREELGLYVGKTVCYRAKKKIVNQFMGDWKQEFARLCDYADMIKQTNPGSSCWIRTDKESEPGKNLFVYFYVCFHALKKGWLEGCRKIIGFDGCFLKGACKGELLVAIGRNGNNQMYPIAWAVVDQETKHSWSWFINYLISDLQLGDGEGLTVMSDMQKGLVPTIAALLPNSEHRMCARHVWSNWSQRWRGEERKNQFWRCAKSSFVAKFKKEMAELEKLGGKKICEDILKYKKEKWCRAYFKEHAKCDIVENNMCETFNSWILAPRHKSVITMLEDIRHKIMNRQADMLKFSNTWRSDIAPMARLILDKNKDLSRLCKVVWNADNGFEILENAGNGFEKLEKKFRHTVDLRNQTCSCRTWELRGIPCAHAVCAFYHLNKEPEDYVDHWYRRDTFVKAYKYFIQPIPNLNMWPESTNPSIEPPAIKPMPGRPRRCRRKGKNEPKKRCGKLSKKGVKMTCSKCHQVGHTKKACQARTGMGMPTQPSAPSSSSQQESTPASQPSYTAPSSICDDTSAVRRVNQAQPDGIGISRGGGIGRGRGRPLQTSFGAATGHGVDDATSVPRGGFSRQKRGRGSSEVSAAQKRQRNVGFGLYTDHRTGSQILNPGTSSERLVFEGRNVIDASITNIDIGFKPKGLQWKGRNAVTTGQLQNMAAAMKSSANN